MTWQMNERISVTTARRRLQVFSAMAERYLLGKNFAEKPSAERSLFFAFLEDGDEGTRHWHILWKLPPACAALLPGPLEDALSKTARRKIAPASSLNVQDLRNNAEYLRVITYASKEFGLNGADRFVLSTEFESAKGDK